MKRFLLIAFKLIYIPFFAGGISAPFENSNYFESGELKIHYRVWAPEGAKINSKVFLLHGFCGSTFSWRNNIEELLQSGNIVVAVDLPPFGFSEKETRQEYSFEEISEVLWSLLDQVDGNIKNYESWSLAGHSMGAEIVTRMTSLQPDKVSSLIIVDGLVGHYLSDFTKFLLRRNVVKSLVRFTADRFFLKPGYVENMLTTAYGRIPTDEEVQSYLNPMLDNNFVDATMKFSLQMNGDIELSAITVPVLLVWGEKDKWITLDEAKELKGKFANSTLVTIPDAHHCPMETHSDEFNSILAAFLHEHDKGVVDFVRK